MQKYGKAKWLDLEKNKGNHLSSKQLRKYLNAPRKEEILKIECLRNNIYYMIGDAYQANCEVINKALVIGEDGEI